MLTSFACPAEPGLPKIGSLDLTTVRKNREAGAAGLSGDHALGVDGIPMSPRAQSDAVLETPRTAMGRKDAVSGQFGSAEELHGDGPVAIASNGDIHASIGVNGKLAIWAAKGVKEGDSCLPLCQVVLQLPPDLEAKAKKLDKNGRQKMLAEKPPKWMAFDCTGEHLGVHRPGVGMWMCSVHADGTVSDALLLGDGPQSAKYSWVGFSSRVPGLLAVGTDSGRVMMYAPKTGKLTSQREGKHPGKHVAIGVGDWLADGRLAVASGERMKVSNPVDESASWETFAKFYIDGMRDKIPKTMVTSGKSYDATPGYLGVSKGSPPYIAMTLGDKVVTIMDYSGVYKEEGFFIPLDYGHIVGMVWVNHEVLVIGLANGYVVLVSAPLLMRQRKNAAAQAPGREDTEQTDIARKSMSTTRVFTNYLSACLELEGSPAVLGDKSLKVLRVDMAKWGQDDCLSIAADIEVDGFEPRIGVSLNKVACIPSKTEKKLHVAATSTGGKLHGFTLPGSGAATHGA